MFRALRVEKPETDAAASAHLRELADLQLDNSRAGGSPTQVIVDVDYSSVNFKDGLALAGRPGVLKSNPMTPGIDLVGRVAASADSDWQVGDRVIVTGYGIGESHDGGLAESASVDSSWLVRLPETLEPQHAAAIGTAGFTAMLAILALERHAQSNGHELGQSNDDGSSSSSSSSSGSSSSSSSSSDILVTGAAGGVGSIAIALLAASGHRVVASTGRQEEADYLTRLGAAEVIDRTPLGEKGKPMQSQRWAAAIDSVGSHTLVNALAQTSSGGAVATCGLAQGADLPGTVLPFILRGVSLLGINSVYAPHDLRVEAWARLATDLDRGLLDGLTTTIGLADAPAVAEQILDGRVRGRTVVDVRA